MTEVERWGLLELAMHGGPAAVEFHHESGEAAYVESFPDVDRWLVRFMPSLEGTWNYELAGEPQSFVCTPATTRGPVRRVGTGLRWSDGTPYHPLTTTWFGARRQLARGLPGAGRLPVQPSPAPAADPSSLPALDAQVQDLLAVDIGAEILLSADAALSSVSSSTDWPPTATSRGASTRPATYVLWPS